MVQTQNYPNPFESLWDKIVSIEREVQELRKLKTPESEPEPEIVTGTVLCERVGIDRQTLAKWRKKGLVPFIEGTGAYRYNYPKVIEALEGKKGGRK